MEQEKLPLMVVTRNVKTGVTESRKKIDHNNRDDRVWLGKHCFWAFRNSRSVETFAMADEPSMGRPEASA